MRILYGISLLALLGQIHTVTATEASSSQPSQESEEKKIPEQQNLTSSTRFMLKSLEKENFLTPKKSYEDLFPHSSANARKVIFGYEGQEGESCDIAIKVFKDLKSYSSEFQSLEQDAKYMAEFNQLKSSCNRNLPIIVTPLGATVITNIRGESEGVIILEMAKGKTIKDIMEHITDYSTPEIMNIFRSIGSQLGAMDALFYKEKGKLFLHPDSHWENFIYDKTYNQLYWIDTGGLSTMDLIPGQESPRLYWTGYMKNIGYKFINILREEMEKSIDKVQDTPSIQEYNKLIRYFFIARSLFEGYLLEMSKINLENDVKQNYVNFFEDDKSLIKGIRRAQSTLNDKQELYGANLVKVFNTIVSGYPALKEAKK